MANNIVSEWLEDKIQLDYVDGTNYAQAMKAHDYAAKLDRLVDSAKEAKKILNHDGGTTYESARVQACVKELASALEAIKLEEGREDA